MILLVWEPTLSPTQLPKILQNILNLLKKYEDKEKIRKLFDVSAGFLIIRHCSSFDWD